MGNTKAEERRKKILAILRTEKEPVSGSALSRALHVSRQAVVQDMALLRAEGHKITSTNRGYILKESYTASRVFKMIHKDSEVREELTTIIDLGGHVEDVFVYHRVYGVVRAELRIHSRADIDHYIEQIRSSKSKLLQNATSGYHYHTVTAENEHILDMIQAKLQSLGFLAKLQDYEPVDFWREDRS